MILGRQTAGWVRNGARFHSQVSYSAVPIYHSVGRVTSRVHWPEHHIAKVGSTVVAHVMSTSTLEIDSSRYLRSLDLLPFIVLQTVYHFENTSNIGLLYQSQQIVRVFPLFPEFTVLMVYVQTTFSSRSSTSDVCDVCDVCQFPEEKV